MMGLDYRMVVESGEAARYAEVIEPGKLLILDPAYQREFDARMELPEGKSKGSGPARNFIWDHAVSEGHDWHWVVDDNICGFFRLNRNLKVPVADGTVLRCMEDFTLRYANVAMAGPNYFKFAARKTMMPPFVLNTRIYSCILIRNDIPFRWRCRYNEDTDLSLRVLKAGWCTILFNAFLQDKMTTQRVPGGNTDAFYREEGTLPKSRMLAELRPDVARVVWKFGRWHHHVDYAPFKGNKLIRRPDAPVEQDTNEYGMRLVGGFAGFGGRW